MRRRGLFVTFEGIEGSGKSTQLRRLAAWLRQHDIPCILTREPGGTRAGDAIRTIFLGPSGRGLDPWAELFLVEAARAQHLEEIVRPALASGQVVLCDRFTDSTLAYQGSGRGLPQAVIRRLHRLPALRPAPDLTLLFDLPVSEGLARASGRNATVRRARKGRVSATRIDDESAVFHARVRRGFLALARREPRRFVTIPAGGSPAQVSRAVRGAFVTRLPGERSDERPASRSREGSSSGRR